MRIRCPACDAVYEVPDTVLAELRASGREVRCARCAHRWRPEEVEETPPGAAAPEPPRAAEPVPGPVPPPAPPDAAAPVALVRPVAPLPPVRAVPREAPPVTALPPEADGPASVTRPPLGRAPALGTPSALHLTPLDVPSPPEPGMENLPGPRRRHPLRPRQRTIPIGEEPRPLAAEPAVPAPRQAGRAGPPMLLPPQASEPAGLAAPAAAWVVSLLVVAAGLAALWIFRAEVVAAWPAAARLYEVIGGMTGGGLRGG